MNPQNILMISYTYEATFCRTTPVIPENIIFSTVSTVVQVNCVNHLLEDLNNNTHLGILSVS